MSSKIEKMATTYATPWEELQGLGWTARQSFIAGAEAVLDEARKVAFEAIGANGLRRDRAVDLRDLEALFPESEKQERQGGEW